MDLTAGYCHRNSENQNGMDGLPMGQRGTKFTVRDLAPTNEINSYCPSLSAPQIYLEIVIAGLDPAIHLSVEYPWVSGPPDQVRG